jgi:hypothetical protein
MTMMTVLLKKKRESKGLDIIEAGFFHLRDSLAELTLFASFSGKRRV